MIAVQSIGFRVACPPHNKVVNNAHYRTPRQPALRRLSSTTRYAICTNGIGMRKIRPLLLLFLSSIPYQVLAADNATGSSGFQYYFANMRLCLSSDKVESCLPPRIANIVSKAAEDLSKQQFVNLVISDPEFRKEVSSCFLESAQIITSYVSSKLFRSAEYACEVTKIDGVWKLTAFYNFTGNE